MGACLLKVAMNIFWNESYSLISPQFSSESSIIKFLKITVSNESRSLFRKILPHKAHGHFMIIRYTHIGAIHILRTHSRSEGGFDGKRMVSYGGGREDNNPLRTLIFVRIPFLPFLREFKVL